MPFNPNILALLRQTQTSGNAQPTDQGVNPNLEMILQAMGMMPRQLDLQGRPILSGVKNPSTMDQHYARQANPEAMKDRYSSPTFAMGPNDPNRMAPATKLPGQGQIVAHQPISGLPGQVGPAYGTQMTPINMSPSADENAAMDAVRQQYRKTMFPTQTSPTNPVPTLPQPQVSPVSQTTQQAPSPVPSIKEEAQELLRQGVAQWDAGQRPVLPPPMIAGMPDLSGQIREGNPWASSTLPQPPDITQNPMWKLLRQRGQQFQQQFPLINRLSR